MAQDGHEGSRHSLYTEHLAREMRSPGARIDDVFKRVRLQVRLKTRGAQVPWETTSLEADYAFFPGGPTASRAEAETPVSHRPPSATTAAASAAAGPSSAPAGAAEPAPATGPLPNTPKAQATAPAESGKRAAWQAAQSASPARD